MQKSYLMQPRGRGFAFRVRVPLDLQERFGKSHIIEGLGTDSRQEAERRAVQRLAHWRNVFERAKTDVPLTLGEVDDIAREEYRATLAGLERDWSIVSEILNEREWLDIQLQHYRQEATMLPEIEAVERRLGISLADHASVRDTLARALQRAKMAAIEGRITALDGKSTAAPVNFLGAEGIDRLTLKPLAMTRRASRAIGQGPWRLFEMWIEAVKPAASSVERWRSVFVVLQSRFGATEITEADAREWARGLITAERSAGTVRGIYLNAARTIYRWAVKERHTEHNPFATVTVSVPKRTATRESKAFTETELRTILKAALAVAKPASPFEACKRWAPWLAAYSGARMGELTQLRAEDVTKVDGVWTMKITPEAGTVKNRQPRTVPLHEHIIKQGFLDFVKGRTGPLFYNPSNTYAHANDVTNPRRPRAVKQRGNLGRWIRELGITDTELSPTHGFRHTFKQIAERAGITEKMSDAITGHTQANVARSYGAPSVKDMAAALRKFPRYRV